LEAKGVSSSSRWARPGRSRPPIIAGNFFLTGCGVYARSSERTFRTKIARVCRPRPGVMAAAKGYLQGPQIISRTDFINGKRRESSGPGYRASTKEAFDDRGDFFLVALRPPRREKRERVLIQNWPDYLSAFPRGRGLQAKFPVAENSLCAFKSADRIPTATNSIARRAATGCKAIEIRRGRRPGCSSENDRPGWIGYPGLFGGLIAGVPRPVILGRQGPLTKASRRAVSGHRGIPGRGAPSPEACKIGGSRAGDV